MNKRHKLVAFAVLGSLVVLLAGWSLLVSPKRSQAAELRIQAAEQLSVNQALEIQLSQLKTQAATLPKQQAKLAAVAARIPTTRALPALIRALNRAAHGAGVELLSIAPGSTTLLAPTAVTPVAVVAPASPATGKTTPAKAAKPAPADAGQLAQLPVTMTIVGGYFQVEQFLAALEGLPRSLRLTGVTMAPGTNPLAPATGTAPAPTEPGKTLSTSISAVVFMAVNRPPTTPVSVHSAAPAK